EARRGPPSLVKGDGGVTGGQTPGCVFVVVRWVAGPGPKLFPPGRIFFTHVLHGTLGFKGDNPRQGRTTGWPAHLPPEDRADLRPRRCCSLQERVPQLMNV